MLCIDHKVTNALKNFKIMCIEKKKLNFWACITYKWLHPNTVHYNIDATFLKYNILDMVRWLYNTNYSPFMLDTEPDSNLNPVPDPDLNPEPKPDSVWKKWRNWQWTIFFIIFMKIKINVNNKQLNNIT